MSDPDMEFTPREVGIEDAGGPDMVFTVPEVERLEAERRQSQAASGPDAVEANNDAARGNAELEAFRADPTGHVDRMVSRAILMQNFEVIDPETHEGERAGNQVSQEEFDRLVQQYSDVRLGRTDLQLDLEGQDMTDEERLTYQGQAMNDIGHIMQTESGRDLMNGLTDNQDEDGNHRVTRISGNRDPAFTGDLADAADDPHFRALHPDDAYNGRGSSTNVYYHPGQTEHVDARSEDPQAWETIRSDVGLYHELTHAYHATHGQLAEGNVTEENLRAAGIDPDDYDTWHNPGADLGQTPVEQAEYQAVGLGGHLDAPISENAYRRERAEIGRLRTQGALAGDEDLPVRPSYWP